MAEIDLVQFVFPPDDESYGKRSIEGFKTPSPIPDILDKAIRRQSPEVETGFLDGNRLSLTEITERLQPGLTAITSLYSNHLNGIRVAEAAKEKGDATVIMGGPNMADASMGRRVLANRNIDYVCRGDGEDTIAGLVAGHKLSSIPNLWYRQDKEIRFTFSQQVKLDIIHDFSLAMDKGYGVRFLVLSGIRGCIKACNSKRCLSCSIQTHNVRTMDPNLVWQQIAMIKKRLGVVFFWETGDDFFVPGYPEALLAARPPELADIAWRIYASPDSICHEENVILLKKLNVREVFLGVETCNDHLLQNLGKNYTSQKIELSLQNLQKYGINIQVPFMLGIPGTRRKDLVADIRFAERIVSQYPKINASLVSYNIPLLGSELFQRLAKIPAVCRDYPGNLAEDDAIDYGTLYKLQVQHLTEVKFSEIEIALTAINEIFAAKDFTGGFGLTNLKR